MSDFGELFAQRVGAVLEDKGAADSPCPACEQREWTVNHETIALLNHLGDDLPIGDPLRGMSVVAVVCKNCGHVRLHSALHLFD